MKILLTEHKNVTICHSQAGADTLLFSKEIFDKIHKDNIRLFKRERGKDIYPFSLTKENSETLHLKADYYIGVDWLVKDHKFVHVAPKINKNIIGAFVLATESRDEQELTENEEQAQANLDDDDHVEVDYLRVLLDIMSAGIPAKHVDNLVLIDWETSQISVTQQEDRLTPFLIVQYLQLLKIIVRKGLKKSYYKVQENLNSKVKGKILVGQHLKQNIFKNRLTKTYCEYQVFGDDNTENRFLKKVLLFASSYIENNKSCFDNEQNFISVAHSVSYCRPAFEHISDDLNDDQLKRVRNNPFFKEYKEAITIGRHILRKFAYNLSETSKIERRTPPFWIDMPRLFELYCYLQLIKVNVADRHHIHYQFSTYGNALDLLISKPGCEMVIDAKYKLQYQTSKVHQDIRQVAGYARLKKVRNELNITDDRNIDCLIIYPDVNANVFEYTLDSLLKAAVEIDTYHKVYKLGVRVPFIENGISL